MNIQILNVINVTKTLITKLIEKSLKVIKKLMRRKQIMSNLGKLPRILWSKLMKEMILQHLENYNREGRISPVRVHQCNIGVWWSRSNSNHFGEATEDANDAVDKIFMPVGYEALSALLPKCSNCGRSNQSSKRRVSKRHCLA